MKKGRISGPKDRKTLAFAIKRIIYIYSPDRIRRSACLYILHTRAVSISLIKISLIKISHRYEQHLLRREAEAMAFTRVNERRLVRVYSGLIEQARGLVCTLESLSLSLLVLLFFFVAPGIVKS